MRIAVLVSGNGSNLQALIDAHLSGEIVGVLSNKPDAYALERARNHHIATCIIEHKKYATREQFDQKMHEQLIEWNVDLVVLAGFMRILSANFVKKWEGKMVNIHPSLLPAYKGMHTHQRVLSTGDRLHGCTVHFVTSELDAGTSLAQGVLEVKPHDTQDTLVKRIHVLEHLIYPEVVEWICSKKLVYQNLHSILYKQKNLEKPIRFFES